MSSAWQKETRGKAKQAAAAAASTSRLPAPLGQGAAMDFFVRQARQLRLPHALVIEGPGGSGKSTLARWLAAALMCPSELDVEQPCGYCNVCLRIATDNHPDLHRLHRARDEQERKANKDVSMSFHVISVAQVRDAQQLLVNHAVEGRARVLWIEDADSLNREAQNALLKTLEEPGRNTFLLLETQAPESLLPTVRSRVQRLRLLPLSAELLQQQFLQLLPTAAAALSWIAPLAQGNLGQALDLASEESMRLHDLVVELLDGNQGLRVLGIVQDVLAGSAAGWQKQRAVRPFLRLLRAAIRQRRAALAADDAQLYPQELAEPWTSWLEATFAAERDLDLQIPADQALYACLLQFERG